MRNNKEVKNVVFSNLLWRFGERFFAQLVAFLVSVVLARILGPEVYGKVALLLVLTTVLQVFVDSGLGNALIQKKDADDLDFSTVFYANIFFCFLVYILLFLLSPYIAVFYKDISLVPYIRVLGITVLISGIKNVQQAYVSRNLMFRRFFYSTMGGTIAAAAAGLILAYLGKGLWALVMQQLVNLSIDTLILWLTVPWRPKKIFSFSRLKKLYSYGWKLLASALLDTIYTNLRQLFIGRLYSPEDLAFYNRGESMPSFVVGNLNASIDSVLLPAMSKVQDDASSVRLMTRRAIQVSVYLIAPLMIGLASVADIFIPLLLGDPWVPCIPFLRIFCITYVFYPIHTSNLNAIKAMGRSDMFLKLEIIKKILGMAILLITLPLGIMVMAYSLLVFSFLGQLINSYPNRRLLGYSYLSQVRDIFPSLLLSLVMGIAVYFLPSYLPFPLENVALFLLQITVGAIVYISGSVLSANASFFYLIGMIKDFLHKNQRINVSK